MTRKQLLDAGMTPDAIKHRTAKGRLHQVSRGIYAVGRPELSVRGRWMAAVLICGPGAALSHESAAALWGIGVERNHHVDVSVPWARHPCHPGIAIHRRVLMGAGHVTRRHGIPVTTPACTLIDLATRLRTDDLEAAINEADKLDLAHPDDLRPALDHAGKRPGVAVLRRLLDRQTFTLTDSQLERRLVPLAQSAGLPQPETCRWVNGFKVDFHWPDLGLVVETDGLRYHRTAAQQARDRVRDQAHTAAGLTTLRFTHAQVAYEPGHVQDTLAAVARRLSGETQRALRTGNRGKLE